MMHEVMEQQGYALDITEQRLHHEIYLSDARSVASEKLKTVIRHPIKKSFSRLPRQKKDYISAIRAKCRRTKWTPCQFRRISGGSCEQRPEVLCRL